MAFIVAGVSLIALSIFYIAVKLRVIYWVARDPGSAGGVPTLDILVMPPVLIGFGVAFLTNGEPSWVGIIVWAASVFATLIAMWLASSLGAHHERG